VINFSSAHPDAIYLIVFHITFIFNPFHFIYTVKIKIKLLPAYHQEMKANRVRYVPTCILKVSRRVFSFTLLSALA